MDNFQKICSNSIIREKQIEITPWIHFPAIRLGKRKPKILVAHSVSKIIGKQHSDVTMDIQYGTTPMGKSPSKLHRPNNPTVRNLFQRYTR